MIASQTVSGGTHRGVNVNIKKKYFRRKMWRRVWHFFKYSSVQRNDRKIGLGQKTPICRRKLAKNAEHGDHNIDPWICNSV
jgi:hypothetical protein